MLYHGSVRQWESNMQLNSGTYEAQNQDWINPHIDQVPENVMMMMDQKHLEAMMMSLGKQHQQAIMMCLEEQQLQTRRIGGGARSDTVHCSLLADKGEEEIREYGEGKPKSAKLHVVRKEKPKSVKLHVVRKDGYKGTPNYFQIQGSMSVS